MKQNTIYLVIGALVIVAGAYWYFSTQTGNQPPLSATTVTNQAQAQFEALVGELQPITFNTDIFKDPRFDALVDITTSISPEPSGRPDPLAPFPGGGGPSLNAPVSSSATTTAPTPGGH